MNFIEFIDYLNHNSAAIIALATLILVLVTTKYVSLTNSILREQQKTYKKEEVLYALENVYSPLSLIIQDLSLCILCHGNEIKYCSDILENFHSSFDEIRLHFIHILFSDVYIIYIVNEITTTFKDAIYEAKENGQNIIDDKSILKVSDLTLEFANYVHFQIDNFLKDMNAENNDNFECFTIHSKEIHDNIDYVKKLATEKKRKTT